MMSKIYNQVFLDSYSKSFPYIIKSKRGKHYAFCSVCNLDLKIAHGGKSDINDHLRTKRHKDFSKCTSSDISKFFDNDGNEVIKAEVLFTAFILEHNLPLNVADHAGPLFRKMFPQSDVAKKYGSGRSKTAAIISKMADVDKSSLATKLQRQMFAVSTDGSNDSDSQLYPIVVSFFDSNEGEVKVSLLAVPTLEESSTGQNIGNLVLKTLEIKNIPIKNCLALSCDNAPVMVGLKNGVAAVMKAANPEIFVVGCPCHLIHIAAERGANSLPISVSDILIDIFYYLEKSNKRKLELKALQLLFDVDAHKVLRHSCTRWLSLGRCLKRLIEQWDPLSSFFKNKINSNVNTSMFEDYHIPLKKTSSRSTSADDNVPKRKRPSEKEKLAKKMKVSVSDSLEHPTSLTREEKILMFLSSDINKAYCLFLDYIIPVFDKTNLILQSNDPKIHALNSILLDMWKELLIKFVRPDIVKGTSVTEVNYAVEENHKPEEDIIVGSAASKLVSTLKSNEQQLFYLSIKKYYISVCNYVRQKFPINSELLMRAEIADVDKILTKSFKDVAFFLQKFPFLLEVVKENDETEEVLKDKLADEFSELQISDFPTEINNEKKMDKKWNMISKLTLADGTHKFARISKVMLSILSIPHGNSECERVFSIVKKTRTQFRSCLSNKSLEDILIAKNMLHGNCYEQSFDKEFLKAAKSATYNKLNK